MAERVEKDSLGEVKVPAESYFGAQTMRSKINFPVGTEKMPIEVIHAFGWLKKAAAIVNAEMGLLDAKKRDLIAEACDALIKGELDEEFPLVVWQTGSGTQSHMNVNEVLSNYAIQKAGGKLGSKDPIHPNDDVNKSQSSNDTFPTASHIAAGIEIHQKLLPALENFQKALLKKADSFKDLIKIARTHLMDAVPMTLGQEFSGYAALLGQGIQAVKNAEAHLHEIALGGTAAGTGINCPEGFAEKVASKICEFTKIPFVSAPNKFEALSGGTGITEMSSALRLVATAYMKIANDIRMLGSGPRCGLGELALPANEPGSSIMPGKVNPTQCESMTMVAAQVMGNDVTIGIANASGQFELNVFRPVMIYNLLQSIRLLTDSANAFTKHCVEGIKANEEKLKYYTEQSLMLATCLNTHIGYDKASQIVKKAFSENTTLKDAALSLGFLTETEFDKIVNPRNMVR